MEPSPCSTQQDRSLARRDSILGRIVGLGCAVEESVLRQELLVGRARTLGQDEPQGQSESRRSDHDGLPKRSELAELVCARQHSFQASGVPAKPYPIDERKQRRPLVAECSVEFLKGLGDLKVVL